MLFSKQSVGANPCGTKYQASLVRGGSFRYWRIVCGTGKRIVEYQSGMDALRSRFSWIDCRPAKSWSDAGENSTTSPCSAKRGRKNSQLIDTGMVDSRVFATSLFRPRRTPGQMANSAGNESNYSRRLCAACNGGRKTSS